MQFTLRPSADPGSRRIRSTGHEGDPCPPGAGTGLDTRIKTAGQPGGRTAFTRARSSIPRCSSPSILGEGPGLAGSEGSVGFSQRAVELEPTLSYPIWALGCLHMHLGTTAKPFGRLNAWPLLIAPPVRPHWPGYDGFHGECLRRVGRLDEARVRCLAALEDVEKSDHMYRDSNRVVCLVSLGRTALRAR